MLGRRGDRMAFAPHPHVPDVYECDIRIAVVTLGHCTHEVFDFFQENGIVVIGFVGPTRGIVSFGPGIEHPLRGGFVHPRLERRNAERHLHSLVDPSLCGRVEGFPDEMSLFGLDESPRNAQVSAAQAREIVERIGRGQFGAVIFELVRIEVHRPAHIRIAERTSMVAHRGVQAFPEAVTAALVLFPEWVAGSVEGVSERGEAKVFARRYGAETSPAVIQPNLPRKDRRLHFFMWGRV